MAIQSLGHSSRYKSSQPIDISPRHKSSNGTACIDCGNSARGEVIQADIVHGVFLCTPCAKLHELLLPGPHRILKIPRSKRGFIQEGWTIDDIERLTRLGNLRVQQFSPLHCPTLTADARYYMGSSPYYMKQFWLYKHTETFWKHDEKPSERIPKKYINRSFAKKSHTLKDIPNLAARHNFESRVLQSLGLAAAATIPTSQVYQLHLDNPAFKVMEDIPIHPALQSSTRVATVSEPCTPDFSVTAKRRPSIVIVPRPTTPISLESDDEDMSYTSHPPQTSFVSHATRVSVKFPPVLPAVQNVETPLEWSLRMKRYQEEEIEYLGLTTIKPVLSTPTPTPTPTPTRTPTLVLRKPPPTVREITPVAAPQESIGGEESSPKNKYTRLSKQRFEEWLEKISPWQSPSLVASQPSTVADEEIVSERVSSEEGNEICPVVKTESGEESEINTVRMVGSREEKEVVDVRRKVCGECGREMRMEKISREWGVQTDISSRLIGF